VTVQKERVGKSDLQREKKGIGKKGSKATDRGERAERKSQAEVQITRFPKKKGKKKSHSNYVPSLGKKNLGGFIERRQLSKQNDLGFGERGSATTQRYSNRMEK